MHEIDGSCGEGGGQLLRAAVALPRSLAASSICAIFRLNSNPGLAPQHLFAVKAVARFAAPKWESNTSVDGKNTEIDYSEG
ncbi:RNA 3'-terminal phosphate cyclase [Nitrosospira sp. Is2]|uniref:RNA 3'-terminal phosphate cyclase n=1 Tax=Nitrosospira sp. Is2 TaxID=3080532 RepID=UPI00295528CF|nr:RNA 3'-terminal phosphate cyclase [Nitrosospira sp. Is2]WON74625.1 RNA 3'-terminal phosphate cyclase [Nitrosospira sp. Is2]